MKTVSLTLSILVWLCSGISVAHRDPACFFNPLCTCSKPHPDLGKVTCENVALPVVPSALNSSTIYILILRHNNLREIEPRSFHRTGLSRLEITNNELTSLSGHTLYGLDRTLRELDLSDNLLATIPRQALARLTRLRELNLNHNQINEIKGEIDFPSSLRSSLKVLRLSGNQLSMIDALAFKNLASIELIDLSENNLKVIHEWSFLTEAPPIDGPAPLRPEVLMHLNTLTLSDNRLERIPFEAINNVTSLKTFDLRSNLIKALDSLISGRPLNLLELRLDGNKINELSEGSLRAFASIEHFSVAFNPIGKLSDNVFAGVRIGHLDMTGCGLEQMAPGAWTGLERILKGLDLTSNKLLPSFAGQSDLIFFNDSFNNLEALQKLSISDNYNQLRMSPLSLLSSQFSLQELTLKTGSGRMVPFSPNKFEMYFSNIRKLSISKLVSATRLTRNDLAGFGDYNLEELDLSNAELSELTADAFEVTPSLRKLNLANNNLRRVDVNAFKPLSRSLTELNLNNGIASKGLWCESIIQQLTQLKVLSLINNYLEYFTTWHCFDQSNQLTILALDYNSFKNLEPELFKPLTALQQLSISFNRLAEIKESTFSELDQLDTIDLSYNHIRRIRNGAFSNLAALRIIQLQGNEIELIDFEAFSYLPKLEQLNLAHNQLVQFNLKYFDQVGTLTMFHLIVSHNRIGQAINLVSYNQMGYVQEPLSTQSNYLINSIEQLDLSHCGLIQFESNQLLDTIRNSLQQLILHNNLLTNVTSQSVSRLKNLQLLDLSHNNINTILPDALRDDFSLQIINLSHNKIHDLYGDTFRDALILRALSLAHNELKNLPENLFRNKDSLEIVNLNDNKLNCVPTNALRHVTGSLRELHLSRNRIRFLRLEDISLVQFTRLLKLDLSSNEIKMVPENYFNDFSQLKELDLSGNPIRVVSDSLFDGLANSLEWLRMSENELRSIPMINLPKLRKLDLSRNFIATPNSISLSNITALEQLNLAGNQLGHSPNNLWPHLTKLRRLDLSDNPIVSLDNDSFIGLDRLNHLGLNNLTKLTIISTGALRPLINLLELDLSAYSNARLTSGSSLIHFNAVHQRFAISKLIEDLVGLRRLTIIANGSELLFPSKLPPKVKHVKVSGHVVRLEPPAASSTIFNHRAIGHSFSLTISDTNISGFNGALFAGALGRGPASVALDLRNNDLSSLPDLLAATPYPMARNRKLDISTLKLSGNPWNCDCKLAWIRDWLRQLKANTVPFTSSLMLSNQLDQIVPKNITEGADLEYVTLTSSERLSLAMMDIQGARCRGSGRPMLDLFRKELRDCKRNSAWRFEGIKSLMFIALLIVSYVI